MSSTTTAVSYDGARLAAAMKVAHEMVGGAFHGGTAHAVAHDLAIAILAAADSINPAEHPRPTNDNDLRIDPRAGSAVDAASYQWECYRAARTPLDAAGYLVELANAMSDLASWVPGYDNRNGEIRRHDDEETHP